MHRNPISEQHEIEKVKHFKYLGVLLDSTLSWDYHIKEVERKASSLCGAMWRVRPFVPSHALLTFYYACIHSHFQYLSVVWGYAYISKLRKLQTIQNRCLKTIFNKPHRFPTVQLYSDTSHSVLPIRDICELQTVSLVHSILHDRTKHHNISLPLNRRQNSRQANNLQRTRASTNLGQKRFTHAGPVKYNRLPDELKQIESGSAFKNRSKRYLKSRTSDFV